MKMKIGYYRFKKTNKYSKFFLFPGQHGDFKMAVFLLSLLIFQIYFGKFFKFFAHMILMFSKSNYVFIDKSYEQNFIYTKNSGF